MRVLVGFGEVTKALATCLCVSPEYECPIVGSSTYKASSRGERKTKTADVEFLASLTIARWFPASIDEVDDAVIFIRERRRCSPRLTSGKKGHADSWPSRTIRSSLEENLISSSVAGVHRVSSPPPLAWRQRGTKQSQTTSTPRPAYNSTPLYPPYEGESQASACSRNGCARMKSE